MSRDPSLKTREKEILRLISGGLTDAEIGDTLHLSRQTIRWYNKQIYQKLGAANRAQAIRRATELGLLDEDRAPVPTSPAPPPVKFIANGNVHIAYAVTGSGPVDLLFIHGFLSHLELAWEEPEFASFFERLGRHARVILFDKRGVGLSDRIQGAPTLEDTISDAQAVLDAAGSTRAFIMGTSESGAAAVLLASAIPERVRGLILYAATPKLIRDADGPEWASSPEGMEKFIEAIQNSWGEPLALDQFAPARARDVRFRDWWARIMRSASSPSSIRAVLTLVQEIDIRDLLPQVRARTLVIHKRGDLMVKVGAGRYLADHIPGASWVELVGKDHIYFVNSADLLSAVIRFIEEPETPVADTRIAMILAVRSHSGKRLTTAAAILREFDAPVVVIEGDTLATFNSPSRAVQCARRLGQAGYCVGLHVGECRNSDGLPVDYVAAATSEVVQMAASGEVLVSRALRDILVGMDLSFKPLRAVQSAQRTVIHAPVVLI